MPAETLPVEHLFTLTVDTGMAGLIRNGPQGGRAIVETKGGSFEGPRMKGTVKRPGGDWVTLQPDGNLRIDVRVLLETDDGASILVTYRGIGTDGGTHLRTAPLFETGDERYAWLNAVQAVALGRVGTDTVAYEVYRLL